MLCCAAAPLAVACCRSLRVACKTPFSGVQCPELEAFCSDDKPTPVLAAWSYHILHHSDCTSYTEVPYELVSLQELQPHTAAPAALAAPQHLQQGMAQQPASDAEPALLAGAIRSWWVEQQVATLRGSESRGQQQRRTVIALAAVAAGAICVAVVAVAFAMRKEEAAAAEPITSTACEPLLSTAEVYESLLRNSALAAPRSAVLLGAGCGLPPVGPVLGRSLKRDGSGDSSASCLSRVSIPISRLSTQGSGISEHLPQQGLSRCVCWAMGAH
jgi:hypothetical protein